MIIIDYPKNGINTLFHCNCKGHDFLLSDQPIPIFYSIRHAIDSGWIKTESPDENEDIAWVCPKCIKMTEKLYYQKIEPTIIKK